MITIKGVIFDIGGVLLDSEKSFDGIFEEFARALGVDPEKMVALHKRYLDRMLSGKMSAKQFFSAIKKEFHLKRRDMEKVWLAIALKHIKLNKKLLAVTDKMRAHYRLALLSNVSEPRSLVDREFDLYSHFDQVFLSYKLHMQKPSKRTFRHALKKMRLKTNEALFIDDKEINLNAARALGIQSIQFNNNAQLLTELARLGLV
ncbi:MAG TPA: HAD family phosphatase [Candidatus Paceibacterota bacterium]|nr:HAD family phosphatase [Candidatus Paceibacterota bacterium]